jgi:hypothetical protein
MHQLKTSIQRQHPPVAKNTFRQLTGWETRTLVLANRRETSGKRDAVQRDAQRQHGITVQRIHGRTVLSVGRYTVDVCPTPMETERIRRWGRVLARLVEKNEPKEENHGQDG